MTGGWLRSLQKIMFLAWPFFVPGDAPEGDAAKSDFSPIESVDESFAS